MKRQKLFGFLGAIAVAASMTAACSQSDAGITTAVKSKFAADDTVKAYRIDVDTKDKVVTLKGEVETAAARERAVEIARATEGVRDVVECMVLAPAPAPTSGVADQMKDAARDAGSTAIGDAGITAAVKTKMLADCDGQRAEDQRRYHGWCGQSDRRTWRRRSRSAGRSRSRARPTA